MGGGRQGDPCRRWDPSYQTKPILHGQQWAKGDKAARATGGPHRAEQSQSVGLLAYKQSQWPQGGRPVAPNKPNRQWPAVQTKPIPGKGMETNASWRHYERGAERAKQSQLPQSGVQGKYLVEKGVITNSTRKGPWQNKANSRTDGSGRGAASRQGGPCRRWDPSCGTKPISGVRLARWTWNPVP